MAIRVSASHSLASGEARGADSRNLRSVSSLLAYAPHGDAADDVSYN